MVGHCLGWWVTKPDQVIGYSIEKYFWLYRFMGIADTFGCNLTIIDHFIF